MKRNTGSTIDIWASILLLIATTATILMQIYFSGPQTTKLETTLFSVLQFLFSLSFSWILARVSLRNEFQRSQKQFAISAYRRIIEIRKAVERLIERSDSNIRQYDMATRHELDVIFEIAIGIQESIISSVSDWADIIGEEIETVEKIQAIKEQQLIREQQIADRKDVISDETEVKLQEMIDETNAIIEKLSSELPKQLKFSTEIQSRSYESRLDQATIRLQREKNEKGYIELRGFYESHLDKDIYDFKEGDILQVRIGDDSMDRVAVLIAYDDSGNSVGIITNRISRIADNYSDGVNILLDYLRRSQFEVQILDIDRGCGDHERHYFTVKILDVVE